MIRNPQSLFFQTYRPLPIEIVRGNGMYLYDSGGTRYLDMFAGIGVCALGHSDPSVVKAISDQAVRHLHLSNYFLQQAQVELADLLVRHTGYPNVFFSNSGTEAAEGAIKLARRFGAASTKRSIISFANSFHGRTLGALSLMDNASHRKGFGPFLGDITILPFNNPEALRSTVDGSTAAVFLEFIQGEGGIIPADPGFVRTIGELRDRFGFLVVADEVQSGLGRTGRMFAFEEYGLRPDIVLLAKALGGGLPLGAILGNDRVNSLFAPGSHGSTFGGNALACAAGAVLLRRLDQEMLDQITERGAILTRALTGLKHQFPDQVTDVRGRGLMIGVELTSDAASFVADLLRHGVLANGTAGNVLRIIPPLVIGPDHIEQCIGAIRSVLLERMEIAVQGEARGAGSDGLAGPGDLRS